MKLWRISPFADLDGEGGRLFAGRWNSGGGPIVYAAESSALALLEVLIRFGRGSVPPPYQLLEIEAADDVAVHAFPNAKPPEDGTISVAWGDRWLAGNRSALARIPSAVAPKSFNYLINPAHPDASKIKIISHTRYDWDGRLFA